MAVPNGGRAGVIALGLDLPCDEEFWTADSAMSFRAMGGPQMANHNQVTFFDALAELLKTSERQQQLKQEQIQNFGTSNSTLELPKVTSDPAPLDAWC